MNSLAAVTIVIFVGAIISNTAAEDIFAIDQRAFNSSIEPSASLSPDASAVGTVDNVTSPTPSPSQQISFEPISTSAGYPTFNSAATGLVTSIGPSRPSSQLPSSRFPSFMPSPESKQPQPIPSSLPTKHSTVDSSVVPSLLPSRSPSEFKSSVTPSSNPTSMPRFQPSLIPFLSLPDVIVTSATVETPILMTFSLKSKMDKDAIRTFERVTKRFLKDEIFKYAMAYVTTEVTHVKIVDVLLVQQDEMERDAGRRDVKQQGRLLGQNKEFLIEALVIAEIVPSDFSSIYLFRDAVLLSFNENYRAYEERLARFSDFFDGVKVIAVFPTSSPPSEFQSSVAPSSNPTYISPSIQPSLIPFPSQHDMSTIQPTESPAQTPASIFILSQDSTIVTVELPSIENVMGKATTSLFEAITREFLNQNIRPTLEVVAKVTSVAVIKQSVTTRLKRRSKRRMRRRGLVGEEFTALRIVMVVNGNVTMDHNVPPSSFSFEKAVTQGLATEFDTYLESLAAASSFFAPSFKEDGDMRGQKRTGTSLTEEETATSADSELTKRMMLMIGGAITGVALAGILFGVVVMVTRYRCNSEMDPAPRDPQDQIALDLDEKEPYPIQQWRPSIFDYSSSENGSIISNVSDLNIDTWSLFSAERPDESDSSVGFTGRSNYSELIAMQHSLNLETELSAEGLDNFDASIAADPPISDDDVEDEMRTSLSSFESRLAL